MATDRAGSKVRVRMIEIENEQFALWREGDRVQLRHGNDLLDELRWEDVLTLPALIAEVERRYGEVGR